MSWHGTRCPKQKISDATSAVQNFIAAAATELCVVCGKDTGVPVDTPYDRRNGYVDGCGQACAACTLKEWRGQ